MVFHAAHQQGADVVTGGTAVSQFQYHALHRVAQVSAGSKALSECTLDVPIERLACDIGKHSATGRIPTAHSQWGTNSATCERSVQETSTRTVVNGMLGEVGSHHSGAAAIATALVR
jgi:hypothetical protein